MRRTTNGRSATRAVVALGLASALAVLGCGGNTVTEFPPGIGPFDMVNTAPLPTATATEQYPEQLSMVHLMYMHPTAMRSIRSIHARSYIQASPAATWAAVRDPQTGRDPIDADGFTILAYALDPMYQYSFRTHVTVHNIATLEWDVEWRLGVVEGTDAAPTLASMRWQKTVGSDAISVLEGSLVLRAVPGQPDVTEVDYEYHLQAAFSDYGPMEAFLNAVYARLRDRAHGRTLNPNDCPGCPTPPPGY